MKNLALFFLIISSVGNDQCFAQKSQPGSGSNLVRVNLSALVFRNISVEYERKVNHRHSVTFNIHTIPFGKLPFQSFAQNLIDKAYVDMNLAKIGSVGATASYRFYNRKRGVFGGFYFAPMLNYNRYNSALPIQYNSGKTGLFTGNINTFTGGLQVGAQYKLAQNIYLDIWLIGPSYGFSSGTLNFNGSLSINEQAILSAEIEDLRNSLPIYVIKSKDVNSNGATIIEQGPWAGLRGLGINLGFRF